MEKYQPGQIIKTILKQESLHLALKDLKSDVQPLEALISSQVPLLPLRLCIQKEKDKTDLLSSPLNKPSPSQFLMF